jgi:hypothetical protein
MRVAVGLLGVPVGVLTMFVSRRRVLLGLLVLAMRVVVGSLEVVVSGRVMAGGGLVMMLHRGVFGVFGHGASSCKRKRKG